MKVITLSHLPVYRDIGSEKAALCLSIEKAKAPD
jgi:hypothetical protein